MSLLYEKDHTECMDLLVQSTDNFMSVVIFSLLLTGLSLPWLNLWVFSSGFSGYSVLLWLFCFSEFFYYFFKQNFLLFSELTLKFLWPVPFIFLFLIFNRC